LWDWDTSGPHPIVIGYPTCDGYAPTKSGLLPSDLRSFVGVPLVYYGSNPRPVLDNDILDWIRWAEDDVEQATSVLLCQTWVASPPARTAYDAMSMGIAPTNPAGYQAAGYDYDLEDAAYDFQINNARDEGWMVQQLRYRPLQSTSYSVETGLTALKQYCFRYPLLNTFFIPDASWYVEDHDYGLIRLVPSGNIAMLPIYALQLTAIGGTSPSIPGAIWMQYTAGLTPYDYQTRYSFVKKLVLSLAATQALASCQGSINLGMKSIQTGVDGLAQKIEYDPNGAYAGLITTFGNQARTLMTRLSNNVSGLVMTVL
jgi:hypothetical protein